MQRAFSKRVAPYVVAELANANCAGLGRLDSRG